MNAVAVPHEFTSDLTILKIAREIAMDLHPLETILKRYEIDANEWEKISNSTYFKTVLTNEVAAWNSAVNTHERVRIKSASLIEEWLPELFQRMHAPGEALSAKIEGGKLAARLAGLGLTGADVAGVGEKFSVTINLGADQSLKIEKSVAPKVIDADDA